MAKEERIRLDIFMKEQQIANLRNQSKHSPRLFELTIARINRDINKLKEELNEE
jgi:hypothetical protein